MRPHGRWASANAHAAPLWASRAQRHCVAQRPPRFRGQRSGSRCAHCGPPQRPRVRHSARAPPSGSGTHRGPPAVLIFGVHVGGALHQQHAQPLQVPGTRSFVQAAVACSGAARRRQAAHAAARGGAARRRGAGPGGASGRGAGGGLRQALARDAAARVLLGRAGGARPGLRRRRGAAMRKLHAAWHGLGGAASRGRAARTFLLGPPAGTRIAELASRSFRHGVGHRGASSSAMCEAKRLALQDGFGVAGQCGRSGGRARGRGAQQAQPRRRGRGARGGCPGAQGCLHGLPGRLGCASRAAAAHLGAARPRAGAVCLQLQRAGGGCRGAGAQGRGHEGAVLLRAGWRRHLAPACARGRHAQGVAPAGALRGHQRGHHHLGASPARGASPTSWGQPQPGEIGGRGALRAPALPNAPGPARGGACSRRVLRAHGQRLRAQAPALRADSLCKPLADSPPRAAAAAWRGGHDRPGCRHGDPDAHLRAGVLRLRHRDPLVRAAWRCMCACACLLTLPLFAG